MTIRIRNLAGTSLAALLLLTALACGGGERPAASGEGRRRLPPADRQGVRHDGHPRPALGRGVHEDAPGAVVQVTGGGSGTGIAALINGTVDLAQSSRPMKDEEKARSQQSRPRRRRDGRASRSRRFVHESNPVRSSRSISSSRSSRGDHELETSAVPMRDLSTGARTRPGRTTTSASMSWRRATSPRAFRPCRARRRSSTRWRRIGMGSGTAASRTRRT